MTAAFAFTIDRQYVEGNKRVSSGTYTSSGTATGGNIECGLNVVEFFYLIPNQAGVSAAAPTITETFPFVSNSTVSTNAGLVTIITTADEVGYWKAIGR